MLLKIFKPITKRGDAQNTYTKLLLVFNLKPLTSGSGGTNCIMLLLGKVHRYICHHQLIIVKKPVLYELEPEKLGL